MKTSKQLIEERALVIDKITALSAKETLTTAEETELRNAMDQEDALTASIETALKLEKRSAEEARKAASAAAGKEKGEGGEKEMRNFSFTKLIAAGKNVQGLEKELIEESLAEARTLGVVESENSVYLSNNLMSSIVGAAREKRTMTAASGSAGGYLVPTVKLDWFDVLFELSVLDALGVQRLSGLSANTDIPGITTAVTSGWANGETGTQSPADPTLANRAMSPKLLYTATNISKRLLVQTNQSVDAYIVMDMMNSMAQQLQRSVINGAGSSGEPLGILGTTGIQSVAMGTNGAAITFAKVMALYAAVANANANLDKCKWLSNPKVAAAAMQTPIDTGSGFMILPYNSFAGGNTGKIAGFDFLATASTPSTLTKGSSSGNCSALLFGDFSQMVVGQFGGIEIITDDITGARSGYRAVTINQWLDVVSKQPGAIGAIPDILA